MSAALRTEASPDLSETHAHRYLAGAAHERCKRLDEADAVYAEILDRAVSWSVVQIPVEELDARGMHVTNLEALRRAVCTLDPEPDYVLTDGFPVPGLARPGTGKPSVST